MNRKLKKINGKVVIITGASSGLVKHWLLNLLIMEHWLFWLPEEKMN